MMSSESFESEYSKYYDLLYNEKNYRAEAEYISQLIRHFDPNAVSILEYGCGTGNHAIHLNHFGYSVHGLDKSPHQVAKAESKGLSCQIANIVDFNLHKEFDVCIALFHVMSYMNTNDQLISVFENTHTHLKANGIFIFDVWFTPAVLSSTPVVKTKRIKKDNLEIVRVARPSIDHVANVVDILYEVTVTDETTGQSSTFEEQHGMRHFGIQEIELIAGQTGFFLERVEQFGSGQPPSEKTWGVNFVLKKL